MPTELSKNSNGVTCQKEQKTTTATMAVNSPALHNLTPISAAQV